MVLGATDGSFPTWLPLLHSQPPDMPSGSRMMRWDSDENSNSVASLWAKVSSSPCIASLSKVRVASAVGFVQSGTRVDFVDPFSVARERKAPGRPLKDGRAAGVTGTVSNSVTMVDILGFAAQRSLACVQDLSSNGFVGRSVQICAFFIRGQVNRRGVL